MSTQNTQLSPRPRQRRLSGPGLLLIVLLILFVGLPVTGFLYETAMAAGDADRYPPPGQLVDVNGHRMHLNCTGDGSPVVILESEFAGYSLDWVLVQPQLSQFTRVCAYDRAGYGWSEPASNARTPGQIAQDLHTLLANADIDGPYVLVGHSLGGKYVRLYASLYPEEVSGMVLVDARHESVEPVRTPEENEQARQDYAASLGLYSTLRQFGVARTFGVSLLPMLNPVTEKLPVETRSLIAIFAGREVTLDTMVSESAGSTGDDSQLAAASLHDMPLMVLAAGSSVESDSEWQRAQEMMAALSTNSQLVIVPNASHTIQWDYPEIVVNAVRAVVETVRTGEQLESTL